MAQKEQSKTTPERRYSFRQSSKLPSRYRDFVRSEDGGALQQQVPTQVIIDTQQQPQTRRFLFNLEINKI